MAGQYEKRGDFVATKRRAAIIVNPMECDFEFVSFGPIFPEQQQHSTKLHRHFRDRGGALEALLANELRDRGYEVMGIHTSRGKPTAADAAQLQKLINEFPVRRR
jgi:hypothetical protein